MQIRVFTVDENGFIKIRPKDFEFLLNDVYMEGYSQNSLTIGFQDQIHTNITQKRELQPKEGT